MGGGKNNSADEVVPSLGAFKKELHLQRLLMHSPTLLPGVGTGPLAVAREVSVPREGPIDLIVVSEAGEITLVECKRAVNREARRWVVGQILGYAAWLWKLDFREFRRRFEATGASLSGSFESAPNWSDERFERAVSQNLKKGRFRLLVVADGINEGLKRAVVFLNSRMSDEAECLAVSINASSEEVVGVYGRDESEAWPYTPSWKGARRRILDGTQDADCARAAAGLLRWASDRDPPLAVAFKPQSARGIFKTGSGRTLFRIENHDQVQVSFQQLDKSQAEMLRRELAALDPRFERGKRPTVPLGALQDADKRAQFVAVIERTLEPGD